MSQNRREFLKKAGLIFTTGTLLGSSCADNSSEEGRKQNDQARMKLEWKEYTLQLENEFTIAKSSRKTTPAMLVKLHYKGYTGFGEAAMPPYYPEDQETAKKFYSKLDLGQFNDPFQRGKILNYVDNVASGNNFAKASIDIALHDLVGKLMGQPWYKVWGYDREKAPVTSYTIGMDDPEMVKKKTRAASKFKVLKIKLGGDNDKQMVNSVREVAPDKPLYVDVNEGWKDKEKALEKIQWLDQKGIVFIEQPLPKENVEDIAWLTEKSPLPIIADEAIQRLPDVLKARGVYDGINIKLMKCTGMREAHKMINLARSFDMKVLMGCMTATSCSISAAAQLSPAIDWADLDGNLLISNDPFDGVGLEDGRLVIPERSGIGVVKKDN